VCFCCSFGYLIISIELELVALCSLELLWGGMTALALGAVGDSVSTRSRLSPLGGDPGVGGWEPR
jgi:hypothetical protein